MEATSDGSKRPACDNCKGRKTRCDRGSPCSSCVVAKLDCRISRRSAEKRQRVLISARYDESMENVDRSLQDVSHALQKLLQICARTQPSPERDEDSPATVVSGQPSDVAQASEGYRGDSSFKAHVQRTTDALRDTASNLEFSMTYPSLSATMSATEMIQGVSNSEEGTTLHSNSPSSPLQVQYPELEGRSLPPRQHVLNLLRLAQSETQRFFIDVPVIGEQEFSELCQKVYFAIDDYSLLVWAIVNSGLYYLFLGLKEHNYSRVGVTFSDIQAHSQLLAANIEAAIQSLRLCQDSSLEACQALALLATFCVKSGRTPLAWSLVSAASRMCIDLGLHCLPKDTTKGVEITKKRKIFWHVYILDKSMAFTFGRAPSIHQYDVATERPSTADLSGAPSFYLGFVEFAIIVGDMHIQLFSVAAQRAPQQTRVGSAKSFASRLSRINSDLRQSLQDDPPIDDIFQHASVLLDIITHSLMTIAYRTVPCDEPVSSPLQCNSACIAAARQALCTIVRAHETLGYSHPTGWSMFLNMLFAQVPFACFVVLAGHTVASSCTEDLALLSAGVSAIKPIASFVSGKRIFDICKIFYQFANFSITRQIRPSEVPDSSFPPADVTPLFNHPIEETVYTMPEVSNPEASSHEHIMSPQDWDAVMNEFELGSGAGAMASFIEPYMPFDGRLP